MDFNTLLLRLWIDPSCFENRENEPIKTEEGFIYDVIQRTDIRKCPHCHSTKVVIHDHDTVEINCSETDQIKDILRIKKVRFLCKECLKTFTPDIRGIQRYARISDQTRRMIVNDFCKKLTFTQIAERYGLTTARVIQIFDEEITFVPRRKLPYILCIDEIRFEEDPSNKYCCVLYDFETGEIVDIIRSRQMAYLDEYFSAIKENERENVRYFISDMYDGYRTVRNRYFHKAVHVVDLFHVVSQLTNAVNRIRVAAMNRMEKGSKEYNFMKSHWKTFLCRKERIPDKFYTYKKTGEIFHYDDILFQCLLKDETLLEAHNALQDLFHYHEKATFTEAFEFILYMAKRLRDSGNEVLSSVGSTYMKWAAEISNGAAKNQRGRRYTNSTAETDNNHLKTIIKAAYGYHNFERFRKRALMIITYK